MPTRSSPRLECLGTLHPIATSARGGWAACDRGSLRDRGRPEPRPGCPRRRVAPRPGSRNVPKQFRRRRCAVAAGPAPRDESSASSRAEDEARVGAAGRRRARQAGGRPAGSGLWRRGRSISNHTVVPSPRSTPQRVASQAQAPAAAEGGAAPRRRRSTPGSGWRCRMGSGSPRAPRACRSQGGLGPTWTSAGT
jgi:hypothetical protein